MANAQPVGGWPCGWSQLGQGDRWSQEAARRCAVHRLDGRNGKPACEAILRRSRHGYRDIHARTARLVMNVQVGLAGTGGTVVTGLAAIVVVVICVIAMVVAVMHMAIVGMLVDVQEQPRESARGRGGRHADRRRQGKQSHQRPNERAAGSACFLQSRQHASSGLRISNTITAAFLGRIGRAVNG